jgi:hypothetical protein
MGWQRGANIHVNAVAPPKSGTTMLATWDPVVGDDLSCTWVRGAQRSKDVPTPLKGHTEHVTVQ